MAGGGNGYDAAALGGKFGNKLGQYLDTPAPGLGATTKQGLTDMFPGIGNADYASGIKGAIKSFGDVAAGNQFGTAAPGFAALRSKLSNDVLTSTNSAFNNSGLFGSDSNQKSAAEGLGNALAGLDYGNYQNDISRQQTAAQLLPGLQQASLQPAQQELAAGQFLDANSQPDYQRFMDLLGAFTGSSGNPGMQEDVPIWQQILGGAATGAGIFGSVAKGLSYF